VTQEIKNGFFAKKVVLVEGLTEKLALPYYFRGVGFDPLEEGIEIIGVGGKGNLAKWWRLFTLYEIPTFIIFDNDDDESGERRRDALGALNIEGDRIEAVVGTEDWLVEDEFSVFGVDFENALRGLFPSYTEVEAHAEDDSKPFVARHVAKQLTYTEDHDGWNKFEELADSISAL
jgi:putative ATP-dependent endonuclease of OLD family